MFPSWRRSTRILYILFPGQQVCHLLRMNFQGLRKNFHCPFGSPFLIGILFPSKKASLCGKIFSCLSSGATLKRSEDIARSLTSLTTQQLGWNTAGRDGIRMVFSLSLSFMLHLFHAESWLVMGHLISSCLVEVTLEKTQSLAPNELLACYDFLCQTMRHNGDTHFYTKAGTTEINQLGESLGELESCKC